MRIQPTRPIQLAVLLLKCQ